MHALYYAVVLRRCQSRYDDVAQLAERMRSVAERHGLAASLARANMYGGWAEAMSVSRRQGAKRFNQGLELQQQIGTDENMSIHIDMQSEILQLLGRPAEAVALIDGAITLGRKSGRYSGWRNCTGAGRKMRRCLAISPGVSDLI